MPSSSLILQCVMGIVVGANYNEHTRPIIRSRETESYLYDNVVEPEPDCDIYIEMQKAEKLYSAHYDIFRKESFHDMQISEKWTFSRNNKHRRDTLASSPIPIPHNN